MTEKREEKPKTQSEKTVYDFANTHGMVIGTTEASDPDNRCPHRRHPGTCDQCKK